MKSLGAVLLAAVVFIAGGWAGYTIAAQSYRGEIVRARGEANIYRDQAEKLSQTLRNIRQVATEATVTEKAQQ